MSKDKGGARASTYGREMEDEVEERLKAVGLRELDDGERKVLRQGAAEYPEFGPAWYTRNLKKFENIYGVGMFSDFLVYHEKAAPDGLVLEVKTQRHGGSVDEKYVFTVLSLLGLKSMDTWLIFEGEGARACAVNWMKQQDKKTNRFRFMTFSQFREAMRKTFKEAFE